MEFIYDDEFVDHTGEYDEDMTSEEYMELVDPAMKFAAEHFDEMFQEQHKDGRVYIWNNIKMNAVQNFFEDFIRCLREKNTAFKYSVTNGNPLVGTIDIVFIVEDIALSFDNLKNFLNGLNYADHLEICPAYDEGYLNISIAFNDCCVAAN